MTTRIDRTGDLPLPLWLPDDPKAGIVLVQEIVGLDDYLRSVAEDLAALGFAVAVPELFHRFAPGWTSAHDQEGIQAAMKVAGQLDFTQAVQDVLAAARHLRGITPKVGVLGFCLGGSLAFTAAAQGDPDFAVSFYGSTVPDSIELLDQVTCPIQFHFGGQDPYIPRTDVQKVVDAVQREPNAEIHVQEQAGHAFHNHQATQLHHPEAAAAAWGLTTKFLATV
jgi:carboxymethylenebutenolidase